METATPGLIALLAVSLMVAGLIKGVIGVGMPIVAFPMLSMLVDVRTAVMLLSMPLVLSNIPQALEGGFVGQTLGAWRSYSSGCCRAYGSGWRFF